MPQKSFGKYQVLARLATGGAASIFLARQPGAAGFQKLVCLKTLLPERAKDADFLAMFLDEARLAARLNHPNCVHIYDLGKVRGVYFISMEYIFGETLWNLLTTVTKLKIPLPPVQVALILASACDGLHHAHELKNSKGEPFHLVHRDVSPQNIMVSYEGQTKVVDFGIAKAETGRAATLAGIVKGKFSYMSPEQITGSPVDRRSDIYSLGIVLFECLASRRLYRGETPEDIARLILEHRAPRLRDVVPETPSELDVIVAKALARQPNKRFQTAQEMGDALRAFAESGRLGQGTLSIARLLEDRFGTAISEKRAVYESALMGTYEESTLMRVLEARAVRDVDLFPEGSEFDDASSQPGLLPVSGRHSPLMAAPITAIDGQGAGDSEVRREVSSRRDFRSGENMSAHGGTAAGSANDERASSQTISSQESRGGLLVQARAPDEERTHIDPAMLENNGPLRPPLPLATAVEPAVLHHGSRPDRAASSLGWAQGQLSEQTLTPAHDAEPSSDIDDVTVDDGGTFDDTSKLNGTEMPELVSAPVAPRAAPPRPKDDRVAEGSAALGQPEGVLSRDILESEPAGGAPLGGPEPVDGFKKLNGSHGAHSPHGSVDSHGSHGSHSSHGDWPKSKPAILEVKGPPSALSGAEENLTDQVAPPPPREPQHSSSARQQSYSLSIVIAALILGLSIGTVFGLLIARAIFVSNAEHVVPLTTGGPPQQESF